MNVPVIHHSKMRAVEMIVPEDWWYTCFAQVCVNCGALCDYTTFRTNVQMFLEWVKNPYRCFCVPGCPPARTSPCDTRSPLPECRPGTLSQRRWRLCRSWPGTPRPRPPDRAATGRSISRRRSRRAPASCSGLRCPTMAWCCPDVASVPWRSARRSRSEPWRGGGERDGGRQEERNQLVDRWEQLQEHCEPGLYRRHIKPRPGRVSES